MMDMIERVKAAMRATETDCEGWHDEPLTEIADAAIEAIGEASIDDLIRALPAEKLTGIVMRLTGGSANPTTVRSQASRLKEGEPVGSTILRDPSGQTVAVNFIVSDEGELWRRNPEVNAVIVQAVEGEPDDLGRAQYMHIVSIECRDLHMMPVLRSTADALTKEKPPA